VQRRQRLLKVRNDQAGSTDTHVAGQVRERLSRLRHADGLAEGSGSAKSRTFAEPANKATGFGLSARVSAVQTCPKERSCFRGPATGSRLAEVAVLPMGCSCQPIQGRRNRQQSGLRAFEPRPLSCWSWLPNPCASPRLRQRRHNSPGHGASVATWEWLTAATTSTASDWCRSLDAAARFRATRTWWSTTRPIHAGRTSPCDGHAGPIR
jgi:hypothetical protein